MLRTSPYIFDEFFASGREESISPFLKPTSRRWGKNLPLKSAALSAFLLAAAFTTSFFHPVFASMLLASVYFFVGTPALIDALSDLKNLEINIDVLMTLAALLSILIGSEMEGALLLVLFELSAAIENSVTQKAKGTLSSLHQLTPRTAWVAAEDGTLYEKAVSEIAVGTPLLIKAGELVPLDGIVIAGSSALNLVHLTGESHPISKEIGAEVPAGARNLDGVLTIRVTRTSRDSTLSRIIQLITHAQDTKPKLARIIDRFGKWYAAAIILLFFAFAGTLPWIFSIPYLGTEGGLYRALTFLIAASPCALVIATPIAYMSAISACAKKGIVLKGGIVLDALSRSKTIAFDKTGTLTTGKLQCTSFEPLSEKPNCSIERALALAYALERNAVHPIGEAISAYAQEQGLVPALIDRFKAVAGSGLEAHTKEYPVYIGRPEFIHSKLSSALRDKWEEIKPRFRKEGHLSTLLLVGDSLFIFYFTDQVRAQAKEMIQKLSGRHKIVMLTGDHKDNAEYVAKELNIDTVFADLHPEDKLQKVAELSEKGGLIMVGDGINDAPALARATVGISMGKIGSATAVDASDVVFLQDDLSLLPWLKTKADKTLRIVKENLLLALAVILLATTPALLGLVPLWIAVLLHEGGTVLVGLNCLRLLKK